MPNGCILVDVHSIEMLKEVQVFQVFLSKWQLTVFGLSKDGADVKYYESLTCK
jgi:hypothetical protein